MEQEIKQEQMYSKKFNTDGMPQDKTLREQLEKEIWNIMQKNGQFSSQKIADFYEDKIKSVVREMKKDESKIPLGMAGYYEKLSRVKDYNQFGDDLLERLGIK
jgi:tRNA A37 methylthiotransferase MiaB